MPVASCFPVLLWSSSSFFFVSSFLLIPVIVYLCSSSLVHCDPSLFVVLLIVGQFYFHSIVWYLLSKGSLLSPGFFSNRHWSHHWRIIFIRPHCVHHHFCPFPSHWNHPPIFFLFLLQQCAQVSTLGMDHVPGSCRRLSILQPLLHSELFVCLFDRTSLCHQLAHSRTTICSPPASVSLSACITYPTLLLLLIFTFIPHLMYCSLPSH